MIRYQNSGEIMLDITYDYRKIKQDGSWDEPDMVSEELKQAHKILWSKELPTGDLFHLSEGAAEDWDIGNPYLVLKTYLGKIKLTSDSMINSYLKGKTKRLGKTLDLLTKEEKTSFLKLGYSIGNFILFPGNKINGKNTINVERYRKYYDRFDFTLDAIRKFYIGESSDLYECLDRYKSFFDLFVDFKGYCEFFFLQDFVSADFNSVEYFVDPKLPYIPIDLDQYRLYMRNCMDKIASRNKRIMESKEAVLIP